MPPFLPAPSVGPTVGAVRAECAIQRRVAECGPDDPFAPHPRAAWHACTIRRRRARAPFPLPRALYLLCPPPSCTPAPIHRAPAVCCIGRRLCDAHQAARRRAAGAHHRRMRHGSSQAPRLQMRIVVDRRMAMLSNVVVQVTSAGGQCAPASRRDRMYIPVYFASSVVLVDCCVHVYRYAVECSNHTYR